MSGARDRGKDSQPMRGKGGLIDRSTSIAFSFDGKRMHGHGGDTLASALIANGVKLVGRSFKYHRPRGILSAGSEEPNGLVELGSGARREPNTRATVTELFEGLEASSQNRRGSLRFDLMAVNDWLAPFLSAGFYYKTFMWPKAFWEKLYEPVIRAAAGLGSLSGEPDPDSYDKGFLHCDLLVIGAGPAGISAALAAGRAGLRVILADEDFLPGGRLNSERREVEHMAGHAWAAANIAELSQMPNVRVMTRCTVYGVFDHGTYGALEMAAPGLAERGKPRAILWRIHARRSILAAGATERMIGFDNNDRPGIMLAGAVRSHANRFGALCGRQVAIFTCNDDGWRSAADLAAAGAGIKAIIDSREEVSPQLRESADCEIITGGRIADTHGRHGVHSLRLADGRVVHADCLAVSGGWNPNVHLTCHLRGKPKWREEIAAFVPGGELPPGMRVAGAANGAFSLADALREGHQAAANAVVDLGGKPVGGKPARGDDEAVSISPLWHVGGAGNRAFVDFQNDVTVKDIRLAHQEGFRSVEHLKRYTTLGMATDQGKTANVTGLAVLAEISGKSIAETGTTIFRPPYTPVPIGALAGRARGREFRPVRRTPAHRWAERQGAVFVEAGLWMRAQWFPRPGETHWRESVDREVMATRSSVGICDVTTLGKIDVQGRDAGAFLNHVYANAFAKLPVGKVRYGLMLREDGMVMDDGTVARLGEHHFVVTTTTANAASVFRHLEFCRQCLWPELDVHLISATEQWAQYAIAGPNSRRLLETIADEGFDLSNEAFPFMACGELTICGGTPARLFRISFSGELAYEIAVPSRYGEALAERLLAGGDGFEVTAYGVEALGVMRIEKGHPAGNELNGQTTARDLGMASLVSARKDCIGKVLAGRPALNAEDGLALVGLRPVNRKAGLSAGAHFIAKGKPQDMAHDEGWMTSVAHSPVLGHAIGLGFIRNGRERFGEIVIAADPLRGNTLEVEIVSPHFIDPDGERLRS